MEVIEWRRMKHWMPQNSHGGEGGGFPGGISLCQVELADRPKGVVMDLGGVLLHHGGEAKWLGEGPPKL